MGHLVSTHLMEQNGTTIGSQQTMSSPHHQYQQRQRCRRACHPHLTVAILLCVATNSIASSTSAHSQPSFVCPKRVRLECPPTVPIGPLDSGDRAAITNRDVGRINRGTSGDRSSIVSYRGGRDGGLGDSCRTSIPHNRLGGPLHLTSGNRIVPSSSRVSCFATSKGNERFSNRRKGNLHKSSKSIKRRISRAAQIHCDDALIARIMKGKKSNCPRWRKRTRRAAASFGFRLEGPDDSAEPLHIDPFPDSIATNFNADWQLNSKPANGGRYRRQGRRKRRRPDHSLYNLTSPHSLTPEQYDARRNLWASRYTSLPTLRSTFGTNRNKLWGDFDPSTTRRLYNTLLPRALLGLYEMGLGGPKDLAPLAYEARLVAKKYARERCVVPGRVVAMLYDGFRSWRDWGTWNIEGMSWEQVWYKYESQILDEMVREDGLDEDYLLSNGDSDELTAQICLRILERSCITNERINQLLTSGEDEKMEDDRKKRTKRRRNAERYLGMIANQLDKDMEELMEGNSRQSPVVGESEMMHPIINCDPLIN